MVYYCCVPFCTNRKGGNKFPSDSSLREKWKVAIKRLDSTKTQKLWSPNKYARVCSDHFREEDYKPNCLIKTLREDAVPSIFEFRRCSKPRSRKSLNHKVIEVTQTRLLTEEEIPDIQLVVECGKDSKPKTEEEIMGIQLGEECDEDSNPEESISEEIECETVFPILDDSEITSCKDDTSKIEGIFDINKVFQDDVKIKYYTGFASYDHFMLLFNILGPAAFELDYKSRLGPVVELFALLMKLRHDKDDMELAMFFGISNSTMGTVIKTWINFLYYQLKEIDIWTSGDVVKEFAPADFKKKFPTTRAILDATEILIEKPGAVDMQSSSFSHYKNQNTVKCMIGISPRGAVTYISDAYAGSTSDRQIIERSDLMCKLDCGDAIMVDRGINVQDLFASSNVRVDIPTFLRGRDRLDPNELHHDRRIAAKRIHVERVIGLAKKFKIIKHQLKHTKTVISGRIIYICFSLINLFPAIVNERA